MAYNCVDVPTHTYVLYMYKIYLLDIYTDLIWQKKQKKPYSILSLHVHVQNCLTLLWNTLDRTYSEIAELEVLNRSGHARTLPA